MAPKSKRNAKPDPKPHCNPPPPDTGPESLEARRNRIFASILGDDDSPEGDPGDGFDAPEEGAAVDGATPQMGPHRRKILLPILVKYAMGIKALRRGRRLSKREEWEAFAAGVDLCSEAAMEMILVLIRKYMGSVEYFEEYFCAATCMTWWKADGYLEAALERINANGASHDRGATGERKDDAPPAAPVAPTA